MEAQRKVTCFVTRGSGEDAQLLVHWHTGAGTQVPAGTVEEGESFDEAAIREVREETDLEGLQLLRRLGSRTSDVPEGQAVLRREESLKIRPAADGPVTSWRLGRVAVDVVARDTNFARVLYQESVTEDGSELVVARFEGWVSADNLLYRQERYFYQFHASGDAPDRWTTIENDRYEFHLYWVPLVPKPSLLIAPQQQWLDEFYDALLASHL